jgi:hypothetical protein
MHLGSLDERVACLLQVSYNLAIAPAQIVTSSRDNGCLVPVDFDSDALYQTPSVTRLDSYEGRLRLRDIPVAGKILPSFKCLYREFECPNELRIAGGRARMVQPQR